MHPCAYTFSLMDVVFQLIYSYFSGSCDSRVYVCSDDRQFLPLPPLLQMEYTKHVFICAKGRVLFPRFHVTRYFQTLL